MTPNKRLLPALVILCVSLSAGSLLEDATNTCPQVQPTMLIEPGHRSHFLKTRSWSTDFLCESRFWWPYNFTACGEGLCCTCNETMALCHLDDTCTFVPSLPATVFHLILTVISPQNIHSKFFDNVTSVTHLYLLGFTNVSIASGAFDALRNLSWLSLEGCTLVNISDVHSVFGIKSLETLDISNIKLVSSAAKFSDFYSLPLPHLETFCLEDNDMKSVDLSAFQHFSRLKKIGLGWNQLTLSSFKGSYLPHLTYMSLSWNSFKSYPETCQNGSSLYPNLTAVAFVYSGLSSVKFPQKARLCLPCLQLLDLSFNFIPALPRDYFLTEMFPSLKVLLLQTIVSGISSIDEFAFRNPSLEQLDLTRNHIDFSSPFVDSDSFSGCPKLFMLILQGNDFSDVTDQKFNRLFSPITNLKHLSLIDCKISGVSAAMFANLTRLQSLWLDANRLTTIPDGAFDDLVHLKELTLSRNRISVIKEPTFGAVLHGSLTVLDISNNPFVCSCDLKWFQRFLHSGDQVFYDPYVCDNIRNATVRNFRVDDQPCLLSPETSKSIIAASVMIFCAVITVTVFYRYRWHIRLVLYEAFRGQSERLQLLQERHFRYDVFISYDKNDLDWVRAHLMPELEEGLGLRLCIHERDFVVGQHIVDNIAESVKTSKKVIMVFSSNFARSPWCQFELNFCLGHVLENHDMLLVVLLPDLESRDLTPAMMAVMKTTTYIDWGDEAEARDSFWRRMYIALNELLPV